MNAPTSRAARGLAVAGVMGAVSMLGLGTATAAIAAPTVASPTTTTVIAASSGLQQSLQSLIHRPPYGCIVCGLGGYDPIFGLPGDPMSPGPIAG